MLDCRPPATSGSSPHTRGAPPRKHSTIATSRIIPAYAGSTLGFYGRFRRAADHPRIRGEHAQMPMAVLPWTGSSPHTRGAQPGRPSPAPIPRIIPAYAGSTDVFPLAGDIVPDHPRIRGEHGSTGRRTAGANGIIPAYAGSTWRGGRRSGRRTDHPRIRGEHGFDRSVGKRYMGSSPHTRGALASDVERAVIAGIIPAYAGSTVYMSILAAAISDHPRIRGEHGIDVLGRKVAGGSSPHTRGAP